MHFDVIDDEAIIRDLMREIIAQEGYGVKTFASADDYAAYFSSPSYDAPIAVLSDILMPGMNGISLVRYIHERSPEQKIVLISGTPEDTSEIDGELCAVIGKPFHPARVIGILKALKQCKDCEQCRANVPPGQCVYGIEHACPLGKQGDNSPN